MKRTYVPPSGDPNAKLGGVGEQPDMYEIRSRPPKPFVGPAGRGLDECLMMTKITRREMYLTNVIKDLDMPLGHYINIDKFGRSTISSEGYQYIEELGEELKLLNLNCVVAFGNVALLALTNRIGITKWRGSVLESTLVPGLKVIPTFHPATFIPPKFNFLNKPLVCEDLLRAKFESEFHEIRRIPRNTIIRPDFHNSLATLRMCYEEGLKGQLISIDIEVIGGELDCISFGWSPVDAISIPFRGPQVEYFNIEQELELMYLIAEIIESPKIAKVGANLIFDTQFLFNKYGIRPRGVLHCTQIAQKISYPDFPAGLDFVTSMYTDIPYYKADGKQWMKMQSGTWDQWWTYSAMDTIVPREAFPKQMKVIEKQGNLETYERQRKLIKPLIYMSERGIKVDVQGMVDYKEEQQTLLDSLALKLNDVVGHEINYNSPKQLMEYFYKELGYKPYKKKNTTGKYTDSIDVDALKRLARQGVEAARIMLDIRSLSKRISTYLNIRKVDKDGRMRSSYKPVGAETGRLSSGTTIFGTGCMPPNAEALTRTGWKSLHSLYLNPKEILQWDKLGNLSWCMPIMNEYKFIGNMVEANSSIHKSMYTPDHRVPTISKRGILKDRKASEVKDKSNWFLPISGTYSEGIFNLPTSRLFAVIQADGSIEGNGIRFSFSKQRKIDRFLAMMEAYEIDFTEQSANDGFRRFYIKSTYAKPYIDILQSSSKKLFGPWIFLLDQDSLSDLLDEIKYWDSYIRNDSFVFYTDIKENAEWVATLAHLCNKSATITEVLNNKSENSYGNDTVLYNVNIKPRNKAYQHEDMYNETYYNWKVYCPTVETSYFLCRYKNTIFITGNSNQQNWPHDLLRFFTFDEGYIGYSFDLSQIENRIVAYVGGVIPQIEAFEKGIDLHRLSASVIFGKPYDEISDEDGSSDLGDGRQSERYWGKKANHATNYDVGFKTFALKNELPEAEAKMILEDVHRGYPQIRGGYHVLIQNMLKNDRMVTNLFGRRRLFLGPIYPSSNTPISACADTFRQAYAHFAQSTCADKINEQGLNYIYYNQALFGPIELLAQIHDSIVFQIPLTIPWERHAEMLILIKQSLETPLYWHKTKIDTPVDLSIGLNMSKKFMKEIKSKDFPLSPTTLAERLKEIYDELQSNG